MSDLAAALYPSMPSAAPVAAPALAAAPLASPAPQVAAAPAQAQESPPVASRQAVEPAAAAREAIDGWVPEAVKAARAADVGRKMFDNTSDLAEVIREGDFAHLPPEIAQAVVGEIREMARDLGATPYDVSVIRNELERAAASPLTQDQRIANRESVVEALNAKYGTDAKRALMDARAFIAADPRRAQMLAAVGDTPAVVLRIVELARAAKTARR